MKSLDKIVDIDAWSLNMKYAEEIVVLHNLWLHIITRSFAMPFTNPLHRYARFVPCK